MSRAHDVLACDDLPGRLRGLAQSPGDAGSLARLRALQAHAGACARCRLQHGVELARLEGLCALRGRAVHEGALDGLRERVLAGVAAGTRAGMSEAFLDAPRALARWRMVGVAASVLLVAGAGLMAAGVLGVTPAPTGRERDLRDTLLPPLAGPSGVRALPRQAGDDLVQPVLLPGQGVRGFYLPPQRGRGGRLPAAGTAESGD